VLRFDHLDWVGIEVVDRCGMMVESEMKIENEKMVAIEAHSDGCDYSERMVSCGVEVGEGRFSHNHSETPVLVEFDPVIGNNIDLLLVVVDFDRNFDEK
jgi:hypothetical protein